MRGTVEILESRVLFAFGEPDLSFGVAGRARIDTDVNSSTGEQLLVNSDGKMLVGITTRGLARLTAAGALDSTFGAGGTGDLSNDGPLLPAAVDPYSKKIYRLM